MSDTPGSEHDAGAAEDPFDGIIVDDDDDGEELSGEAASSDDDDDVSARGEGEEMGAEAEDDDDESGEAEADSRSRPKKQTAQERINELTRARREAEREAEALRARLAALEAAKVPEEGPDGSETSEGASEDAPPDPNDFDYGELDSKYIEALAKYHADSHIRQRMQEFETRRQQQEQMQRVEAMTERGNKKHDDFYEKVIVGAEKGEWALSEELGVLLVGSEVGDDIAYHLASNPEEAARVARLAPLEQARYFGKMEAKFSAPQDAAPGKPAVKKPPKAPPPVLPSRGSDGKFQPSPLSDDFLAFEKHANSL